jgi:hypothetical protein
MEFVYSGLTSSNLFLSVMAIFIIHLGLSYWTIEGWLPDPFFRVYLKNMHRAKHGSDSGTYDRDESEQGREWLYGSQS